MHNIYYALSSSSRHFILTSPPPPQLVSVFTSACTFINTCMSVCPCLSLSWHVSLSVCLICATPSRCLHTLYPSVSVYKCRPLPCLCLAPLLGPLAWLPWQQGTTHDAPSSLGRDDAEEAKSKTWPITIFAMLFVVSSNKHCSTLLSLHKLNGFAMDLSLNSAVCDLMDPRLRQNGSRSKI